MILSEPSKIFRLFSDLSENKCNSMDLIEIYENMQITLLNAI